MPELSVASDGDSIDSRLNRLEDLSSKAKELRDSEPLKTQEYCEKALEMIGRESSLKLMKADVLLSYSVALYRTGSYAQALRAAEEAQSLFELLNDKVSLARCFSSLGNIYHDLSDYISALHFHHKSLDIFNELNDQVGIASAYNNLGIVFSTTEDFPESIKFFEKSLNIRQGLGNLTNTAMAEVNLANAYSSANKPLLALEHYEVSLSLFRQTKNQYGESLTLANIAHEYLALGLLGKARSYLRNSQVICEEISNKTTLAYCYKTFGQLSLAENFISDAELYFLKAIDLYRELEFLKEHQETLTLLSNLQYKQGKFEDAFKSLLLASKLKEQFLSEEKQHQITAQKIRYESERFKKESELYRKRNDELAEVNRTLREANQFKLDLIALVSHDLKNPLQTIIGFSDLVRHILLVPDEGEFSIDVLKDSLKEASLMMETISRSTDFMLSLVKDLLDSTAIESNRLQLDVQLYSLSELIEHAVAAFAPVASSKRQILHADIAPNCLSFIDASRIKQVLHNLIDNAIKFSPLGKNIYVRLHCIDLKTAEIRIRDEGQGFSEEDLSKVFGRFQKLSSVPTGKERSTGLGLALCKQIIELHHGTIWIESAGKHQGATIIMQLPLADMQSFEKP